ncbi:MAG: enoyl-CoA hydratase/isomerase family protein [Acidobacteriota bacterium]
MEEIFQATHSTPTPDRFQHIQYRMEGGVARIKLNRPKFNNVLNIGMLEEIGAALEIISLNVDSKIVVFQGSDQAFSSGLDIADHTEEKAYQLLDAFHTIFRHLVELDAVSVSIVKGMALGGGCELAACCDFCLSAEDAKLGQPEIKAGIFPSVATVLYPRLIGLRRTYEMILTGRIYGAKEAERIGLITRALPPDGLDTEAERWVDFLRGFSAPVLRLARQAISRSVDQPFEEALRGVEEVYLNQLMSTEDAKEGLQALLEKRKPDWKHR